jgi:hypothetical protein
MNKLGIYIIKSPYFVYFSLVLHTHTYALINSFDKDRLYNSTPMDYRSSHGVMETIVRFNASIRSRNHVGRLSNCSWGGHCRRRRNFENWKIGDILVSIVTNKACCISLEIVLTDFLIVVLSDCTMIMRHLIKMQQTVTIWYIHTCLGRLDLRYRRKTRDAFYDQILEYG